MLCSLPRQVCHADLNGHNIVVSADHLAVNGVLDFGDMVETPRACDLGVAVAYQVDPEAPAESLADYLGRRPEMIGRLDVEQSYLTTGNPRKVSDRATQFLRRKIEFVAA